MAYFSKRHTLCLKHLCLQQTYPLGQKSLHRNDFEYSSEIELKQKYASDRHRKCKSNKLKELNDL